jgi:hypothetical protein
MPVNRILLGPVHSLHHPNGSLATETFWYQPRHQQFDKLYDLAVKWAQIGEWEYKVRRRLERIQYRDELQDLFIRYTRALDVSDYDVSFNKLWGVLEHLVSAVGNYSDLINRVLFLYDASEREYVRLLLEHLRDVRNGLVHMDEARGAMETYLYQLKWFVEALVRFHLSRSSEFSSLSTAGQFLDLPTNTEILKARIETLRKALRFQMPKP